MPILPARTIRLLIAAMQRSSVMVIQSLIKWKAEAIPSEVMMCASMDLVTSFLAAVISKSLVIIIRLSPEIEELLQIISTQKAEKKMYQI